MSGVLYACYGRRHRFDRVCLALLSQWIVHEAANSSPLWSAGEVQ